MIVQKIVKQGDHYVVPISKEEAERHDLHEGQSVVVELAEARKGRMSPEVRAAFEQVWAEYEATIRAIGPE